MAKRLERALAREIDRIESAHENEAVTGKRSRAADTARVVRTLTSLTETLFKVKQLRARETAPTDTHDHDIGDIDEFRHALAQRIDTLVADQGDAAASAQPRFENADAASS